MADQVEVDLDFASGQGQPAHFGSPSIYYRYWQTRNAPRMESQLLIPSVGLYDLQLFQARHFIGSHDIFLARDGEITGDYKDDEDGLGYYPDGVKRTLTDEQIRIFRHTEIQKLRRERELKEAAKAEAEAKAETEAEAEAERKGSIGPSSIKASELQEPSTSIKPPAKLHEPTEKPGTRDMSVPRKKAPVDRAPGRSCRPTGPAPMGRRLIRYDDD